MYTHIYYYIDQHNRLSDFGTHRGDTKQLAKAAYEDALKKDSRMRARERNAIWVSTHVMPTAHFTAKPSLPFDGLFIIACCDSELTKTETDIMILLRDGKSDKEIQKIFNISKDTVGKHLQHIYKKLNEHTRLKAVAAMEAKARTFRFPGE